MDPAPRELVHQRQREALNAASEEDAGKGGRSPRRTPRPRRGRTRCPAAGPAARTPTRFNTGRTGANALSRVEENGTPAEKAKVRAAVKRKYPDLPSSKGKGGSAAAKAKPSET